MSGRSLARCAFRASAGQTATRLPAVRAQRRTAGRRTSARRRHVHETGATQGHAPHLASLARGAAARALQPACVDRLPVQADRSASRKKTLRQCALRSV
ncbi:hypothetical protein Bcep18194_B1083 [Burkholderia lata]|uniref:Uncharacterized protein n=1 Tax=Burkholderia lata (strain ATCC 17760 / DSM 23089 / LMG 22485 / NCIMB 9086 / R18194 / 383) TaxID=482957 RepID=Q398B4_BURL3|nr:hypothetical protein Bcep18194_B1083 [Burkholderia lata]